MALAINVINRPGPSIEMYYFFKTEILIPVNMCCLFKMLEHSEKIMECRLCQNPKILKVLSPLNSYLQITIVFYK